VRKRLLTLLSTVLLLVALVVVQPARPAAAAPHLPAGPSPRRLAAATVWHVVAPGETMASIAAAFGLPTGDLARWNQIVAPYPVHVDETLRLTEPLSPLAPWRTSIEQVTPGMINWNPARGCPVPPADLRRIWVSYIDFQGAYHDGSIIVHQSLAARVQRIFFTLFRWRYRIMAMSPMSVNMPGQTDMSIVTAGYNCRPVAGTKTWSEHAYGRAIDINPLQNPMVRGALIDPAGGALWLTRARYRIGMMHATGAVKAFAANGFYWGGGWQTLKDYQHFSSTNR
jgi:LysM repeat protein